MIKLAEKLISWSEGMHSHKMPRWDLLPDIDLYMDQVITYMEKHLSVFINNEEDKIITPSMINNYVKFKQIPSPVKKRYSREHLGYLLTVCMLKQVLPINDISKLINGQKEKSSMTELYESFCTAQDEALKAVSDRVRAVAEKENDDNYEDTLSMLALKLAVEANASRIASEKILNELEKNSNALAENKGK